MRLPASHKGVLNMVELLKVIVWPATIIFLIFWFQEPVFALLMRISQRATRFKVLAVEVELGALVPASPMLNTTAETLKQADINASGVQFIIAGIKRSAASDYALITLRTANESAWLTSRLFLFSAFLDRNRAARCIVFTDEGGVFIGCAAPRNVRASLGARFPEYELALLLAPSHICNATAPEWNLNEFKNGELSESALNVIARNFLQHPGIVCVNNAPPKSKLSPNEPECGWVRIDRSAKGGILTWEHAEYVTADGLRTILGNTLELGRVTGMPGPSISEAIARSIISQSGTFVAFVGQGNKFLGLCDRTLIADKVARSAASESASA